MFDDPRTKARSFLESSSIVTQLEDVLNELVYQQPDDIHGFLANSFLDQSKQPQIAELIFRRLIGPTGEPAVHIDINVALRNKTERHDGLTINLSAGKLDGRMTKQLEALFGSSSLSNLLTRIDLFDQSAIDGLLENYRSKKAIEMAELAAVELEPPSSDAKQQSDIPPSKTPAPKRAPTLSAGGAKSVAANKKGPAKGESQSIEVVPDEPEPVSFAGQLLITGISLSCRVITARMQQSSLYPLFPLSSNLSMPLPIIPILQSGPTFPGKQAIINYYMLIPTPKMINNEQWIHKLHEIVQYLRDALANAKGATLQSSYATNNGCLVFPLDKPEQGFDLLQNAVNTVCGSGGEDGEYWFDYAVQMGPYDTFDYTRGKYELIAGAVKTPDELADTYVEWINAYPRCIMLIDCFRHADTFALSRLCDRVSNRCYITSTDVRRSRNDNTEEDNTINCHLLAFDGAPTVTEMAARVTKFRELNGHAVGLFERAHQEVTNVHLADLAVGFGCRFIKLPGILSLGANNTFAVLQRLTKIRDELEATNDDSHFAWPKPHEFIHIPAPITTLNVAAEPDGIMSPTVTNAKTKDKKKRP